MKAFTAQNWQTEENVTSTCHFFTAIKCSQSVHSIVHDNEKFSKRTFYCLTKQQQNSIISLINTLYDTTIK